jgi:hypothetical protein
MICRVDSVSFNRVYLKSGRSVVSNAANVKGTLDCMTKLAGKVAVAVADGNVKFEDAVRTVDEDGATEETLYVGYATGVDVMVPEAEYVPCVCGAAVEIIISVEAELKL